MVGLNIGTSLFVVDFFSRRCSIHTELGVTECDRQVMVYCAQGQSQGELQCSDDMKLIPLELVLR